jgi:phenylacetate-CoA ligase
MMSIKSNIKATVLKRYCSIVAKYDHWTKEQHQHWQFARLKKLLTQAECHVPFYRRRFREMGFRAEEFEKTEDLERLPFITKAEIRRNGPADFCDERIPSFLRGEKNTGGSSGVPCPLLDFRPFSRLWEQAFMTQQWQRIGYRLGDRLAVLRGRTVLDGNRIFEFQKNEHRLILSTYALTKENVADYLEALNQFKVRFLHVYPASLALLLEYIRASRTVVRLPHLAGVFAGSEMLLDGLGELCEKVLGVPCYHWYGHSEGAVLGGWCESKKTFHFFPQYGFLELLDENGTKITAPDQLGEIIATGFSNPAMILIRYRTSDLASGLRWERCGCGREFQTLDRIHGRTQDFIVASDGFKVPVTALLYGLHLPIFDHYAKIQIEQSEPGTIKVRLENPDRISHTPEIQLTKTAMEGALKGRIFVSFEEVDVIPTQLNGKHQVVVQHLL